MSTTNPSSQPSTFPLHIELVGEGLGTGMPCFVVHGCPGLHHEHCRGLDPLATGRQLVYWDQRGHGRSAPLPDGAVSIARFADDAVAVADHLGIERFAVLGHSFGGWVAQELALRNPERVSALVLVGTMPGGLGATESADALRGAAPPVEVMELLAAQPTTDAELVEHYARVAPYFFHDRDPRGLFAALSPETVSVDTMTRVLEAFGRWSAVDRLEELRCPTLLVAGRHDAFCPPAQLDRIAARVPHADQVVFEHSGHFMWLEEPDRFFPLVGDWLDQQ